MELIEQWKIHDAVETYGIRHWGKGYFAVGANGHLHVHPTKDSRRSIDLKQLVDQLQLRGIVCEVLPALNPSVVVRDPRAAVLAE